MFHSLLFITASVSIGYILYTVFYWRQMHCIVELEYGNLDAIHILIILGIVGFVLSLF